MSRPVSTRSIRERLLLASACPDDGLRRDIIALCDEHDRMRGPELPFVDAVSGRLLRALTASAEPGGAIDTTGTVREVLARVRCSYLRCKTLGAASRRELLALCTTAGATLACGCTEGDHCDEWPWRTATPRRRSRAR